jgi:hypothetical protein
MTQIIKSLKWPSQKKKLKKKIRGVYLVLSCTLFEEKAPQKKLKGKSFALLNTWKSLFVSSYLDVSGDPHPTVPIEPLVQKLLAMWRSFGVHGLKKAGWPSLSNG